MSSPFEDKIWDYIAKHRTLKLLFVAVAVIGIVSSAAKTVEPLWTEGSKIANRYLGLVPSSEIRERYGCAFQSGQTYWMFSRSIATALLEPKTELFFINATIQEIARCEVMFGFAPVVSDLPAKVVGGGAPLDTIKEHFAAVTNNWNHFQAFLVAKDRRAALLLRIGSELAMAKNGLGYFRSSDPKGFAGPLHPDLQEDTVKELEQLLAAAQSEFPYKLPEPKLATSSAEALLRSISDLEARYVKYFRGES